MWGVQRADLGNKCLSLLPGALLSTPAEVFIPRGHIRILIAGIFKKSWLRQ